MRAWAAWLRSTESSPVAGWVRAFSRNETSPVSGRRAASAMSMPAIVTARASGLRRLPWHMGQSLSVMKDAAVARIRAEAESAKVCSTQRFGLMYVPL